MVQIGHISTGELWNVNKKRLLRYMRKFLPFLAVKETDKCIDMGETNPKMEYIKNELRINVTQVSDIDFNFGTLDKYYGSADVVFALEVLEHVQNPLWFMREMKRCLKNNGSIYVTLPSNPKWLWVDGHYFEIPRKHFEKWIVEPLGLRIVRHKKITNRNIWRGLLIGYRPLMRVLRGHAHWKSLVREILYFKFDVYEIKRKD